MEKNLTFEFDDSLYEQFETILEALGNEQDSAEIHGLLTGYLCAGVDLRADNWYQILHVIPADQSLERIRHEHLQWLMALFEYTSKTLRDSNFDFNILRPSDESALSLRLFCLGRWCQGFVFGVNILGSALSARLGKESQECLEDMEKIIAIDEEAECPAEEGEADYTQLVEYVRMVAIMIFCDISQAETKIPPLASSHHVH